MNIIPSSLIARNIDTLKMTYGIGCGKLHLHKVISGKYNLSYKLSFYNINKVLKTFKKYLV